MRNATKWSAGLCLLSILCVPEARAGENALRKNSAAKREVPQPESSAELLAAVERLSLLVAEQGRQLEAQREAMRQLELKLAAVERQMRPPAQAAQEISADANPAATPLPAMPDAERGPAPQDPSSEGLARQLGNFRFSGDLRMRYEPFLQDGALARNRYRVRARFNVLGNISDELSGGITLSTGQLDEVNSSNQTFTSFFTRKNIGFSRMFIHYRPKALHQKFTFGAGKFDYPWVRTPLTFDSDISPEGFSQTLSWEVKNSVLKNLTLVGFELSLAETGGTLSSSTGLVTSPGYDSWIFGSQLQSRWQLHDRVSLGLHVAGVNFINSDRIAAALGATLSPSLANSNTLRSDASGATLGYSARFLYLDTIAQLDLRTASPRWPVQLVFNFERNMRGTRIPQVASTTPSPAVENPERNAWWLEAQFGRLAEPRDFQFGYTFVRIEKDAVIGAFNESDMRASTNVRNHRFNLYCQAYRNVQLHYTLWVGKLVNAPDNLNLVPPGRRLPGSPCDTPPFTACKDSFLKRMQFDVVYRF